MAGKAKGLSESDPSRRPAALIFVGVGTFIHGFDELIVAADQAASQLGLSGVAQVGYSSVTPKSLSWTRFFPSDQLSDILASSDLALCHAGMGLIGDSLRAGCRTMIVPRRGTTTGSHPANDQLPFARRLAAMLPVLLCERPSDIIEQIPVALGAPPPSLNFDTNAPALIADFLQDDDCR